MEWDGTTKYEIVSYISRRTTPKKAKELLRICLAQIEILERANASFGTSMNTFVEQLPSMLNNEIERRASVTELRVVQPKEITDGT